MIIFWILILVIVVTGFILGYQMPMEISPSIFPYMSVIFLALLDTLLFNLYLVRENQNRMWSIFIRLVLEIFYGCFLIFFGDQSGLDLYMVAVIPLGAAVFYDLHQLLLAHPKSES